MELVYLHEGINMLILLAYINGLVLAYINGLVQDYCNAIAKALELQQPCTKRSARPVRSFPRSDIIIQHCDQLIGILPI